MIELAEVGESDYLLDLGAGDGRICCYASLLCGAKAWGVELDDVEFAKMKHNVEHFGLAEKVKMYHGDLSEIKATDLEGVTVITLYLLQAAILSSRGLLDAALDRGCTIVCQSWGLPWMTPVGERKVGPTQVAVFVYRRVVGRREGGGGL